MTPNTITDPNRRPATHTTRESNGTVANWLAYLGIAGLIVFTSLVLDNKRTMSAVWYGPYLSAAENVSWGGDFLVNDDEVKAFREMTEEQRQSYRFSAHDGLQKYIANPMGFAYVIAAAKRLFPWLADVQAIEALQIGLHTLLSLLLISLLDGRLKKALFLVLYALNPLVIYYVTFPYYYFYQAIPSFALLFLLLGHRRWRASPSKFRLSLFLTFCIALAFVLLMRSTTVAAIAAFFALGLFYFPSRKIYGAGLLAFVVIVATGYASSQKNFWHTAYVGVGAYPNAHVVGLSDDNGYALFEQKTGVPLDASLGGNYYDSAVMAQYRDVSRDEFIRIAREDWPSLLRNAGLNTLQGFSVGYLVGQTYMVHMMMAAAGLGFALLMLFTGQWLLAGLVLLTSATFVPYYPPIPAYMYGGYALLVIGLLQAGDVIFRRLGRKARTVS